MNNDDPIHAFCSAVEEVHDATSGAIITSASALAAPTIPMVSASTDAITSINSKEEVDVDVPLQRPTWVSNVDRAFLVCRKVHLKLYTIIFFHILMCTSSFVLVNMSSLSKFLGKQKTIQVRMAR